MYLIDKYTHLQEITAKISKSNGEAAQLEDHFLQDQHHSPTPLTGRSPSMKSPNNSNKKKKASPSPKNYE